MVSRTAPRVVEGDQLAAMLHLLDRVDGLELKLAVPDSNIRSAIRALELDPLEAQIRQVFFLDTPDLRLDAAGLVVRLRRVQGRDDDTVVKLRPVDPDAVAEDFRKSSGFTLEVDAMPGGYVCSGSFRGDLAAGSVRRTILAGKPLRKLFGKGQRAFFEAYAPKGIGLDDLVPLGPIFVLKLRFDGVDARRFVAELWLYPDGSRLLELSTRCLPDEAVKVARESRAFLTSRGIDLEGHQTTKTRAALKLFSRELAAP
jgi:hypothetical protein